MSSKRVLRSKINKAGASRASAQLKIILSLLIVGIAAALLIGGIHAKDAFDSREDINKKGKIIEEPIIQKEIIKDQQEIEKEVKEDDGFFGILSHVLDSILINPQLIGARCEEESSFSYNSINITVPHTGTHAICEINLTLNNTENGNFTIQDVIYNETNITCSKTNTTLVECTNTTVDCLASGTDAIIGLNMSTNITEGPNWFCEPAEDSEEYVNYTWTVDTLDINDEANSTTNVTQLDRTEPDGTGLIVNSSEYYFSNFTADPDTMTYFVDENTYDLYAGVTNDSGMELNTSSCSYNSTTNNSIQIYERDFSDASYNGSGCFKTDISISANTHTYPGITVCDDGFNCGEWNTNNSDEGSGSATIRVYYDNSEPEIEWNTPLDGANPPTETNITVNVTFEDGVNESGIDFDSINFTNNASLVNTSALSCNPSGGHYVEVTCTQNFTTGTNPVDVLFTANSSDNVGNENSTSITIHINDTIPPEVNVTNPNGGELFKGGSNKYVNWTASDNDAVNSISIEYYDGSSWNVIATGESNDGVYDWSVPSIDTDKAKIRINATDNNGNTNTDTSDSDFTIDSTKPIITGITPPDNWSEYGSGTPMLEYSITDHGSGPDNYSYAQTTISNSSGNVYTFELNDGSGNISCTDIASNSTNCSLDWSGITPLAEGEYNVTFFGQDAADNGNTLTYSFEVDLSGPEISWNTPMDNANISLDQTVTLNVTVTDSVAEINASEPDAIDFDVNCVGGDIGTLAGDFSCNDTGIGESFFCTQTWTTPNSIDGCNITAIANDTLDNENTDTINVTIHPLCGDVIDSSGVYLLEKDIDSCPGTGISVNSNDVTIDCDGYSITGDGSGDFAGVAIGSVDNVTLRNCTISGFSDEGIYLGSTNSTIEYNTVFNNTNSDITVEGADGSVIANNTFYNSTFGIEMAEIDVVVGVNVTDNNITENSLAGIYANDINNTDSMVQLWHNDIYNNNGSIDGIQVRYGNGNLSGFALNYCDFGTGDCYGNYWGIQDHCPYFRDYHSNVSEENGGMWDYDAYDSSVINTALVDSPECITCGEEINWGPETIVLTEDVYNSSGGTECPGTGITVNADNVTIDCDNYWVTGNNGSNQDYGIKIADSVDNATIKNCKIAGYSNTDGPDMGIKIYSHSNNTLIQNNTIYMAGYGIHRSFTGTNPDYNASIIGNKIFGTSYGSGIYYDEAVNLEIRGNIIKNTGGNGIEVEKYGANLELSNNSINNTGGEGVELNETWGLVQYNTITFSSGEGIYLSESSIVVDNNTITHGNADGIEIFANGPIANITNNTITNNTEDGLDFTTSIVPLVWHNNIHDNAGLQVRSGNPIQLSYANEGNYWGRTECPTFIATIDSNSANVVDSYAYNQSWGWITYEEPPMCTYFEYFLNEDTGEMNTSIGVDGPFELHLVANISNSTAAWVNLSTYDLCVGDSNQAMEHRGNGIFNTTCLINSSAFPDKGGELNITAFVYDLLTETTSDEENLTIYYDFENPRIQFEWWETKDAQGDNITLPHFSDFLNESDMFFSNTDNTIYFKINATDNLNVGEVYVVFTKEQNQTAVFDAMDETGGDCEGEIDLSYDSGFWVGSCNLGSFNEETLETIKMIWQNDYGITEEDGPVLSLDAEVYAEDDFNNTNLPYNTSFDNGTECDFSGGMPPEGECMPALAPILLHDIGVMGPTSAEGIEEEIEDWSDCYFNMSECEEDCGSEGWDTSGYANCTAYCEAEMDCVECGVGEDPDFDDCDYTTEEFCFYLDADKTTNFNEELNFSSVEFGVGMKANLSCLAEVGAIDTEFTLPSEFETMAVINLTDIDFNNQETGMKLAMLPENIDILVNFPGEFGESYIYVNSTAFAELNTDATIKFFHLPFTAEPEILWEDAAGVSGTATWDQMASDSFWNGLPAGNLTFNVLGFSDYSISDEDDPVVTIDTPEAEANLSAEGTWLNMTINGTGTQMSNVLVYLDETNLIYNYSADPSKCYNESVGSEIFYCNISVSGLSDGEHTIKATAFDYGDEEPGNNGSAEINVTVDTTPPSIIHLSWDQDGVTTSSITVSSETDENASCFVEFGETSEYGGDTGATAFGTEHEVTMGDLSSGTLYYFRWNCTDTFGNSVLQEAPWEISTLSGEEKEVNDSTETNFTANITEDGKELRAGEFKLITNQSLNGSINMYKIGIRNFTMNLSGTVYSNGDFYNIESDEFNETNIQWVFIKLYYNESKLPDYIDESTLKLYWLNGSGWEEVVPGGVNTEENYVWGNTTHFSIYTPGGEEAEEDDDTGGSSGGGTAAPPAGQIFTSNLDSEVSTEKQMSLNDIVEFTINSQKHTAKLLSLSGDSALLDVSSETQRVTLWLNDPKTLDVDEDGSYDIEMELVNRTDGTATIKFSKFGEDTTEEAPSEPKEEAPMEPEQVEEEQTPQMEDQQLEEQKPSKMMSMKTVIGIIIAAIVGVIAYMFVGMKKK